MHDPMAMRPFMGYNFGMYLKHWVNLKKDERKVPKIFHVNWFRKSESGDYLWPGYGDNIRVIDWIIRRLDGEQGIGKVYLIEYNLINNFILGYCHWSGSH